MTATRATAWRETRRLARTARFLAGHPGEARHLPEWGRSLAREPSPLEQRRPWLPFRAQAWLESVLAPTMRVFEYGSGGSTLFFGSRVARLVSVEHDADWHAKVLGALEATRLSGVEMLLRPPAPIRSAGDDAFGSAKPEYAGSTFRGYVEAIDGFPDGHFDLVVVDGRARVSCVLNAVRAVRPGGFLLLDNSERLRYRAAFDALAGHARSDMVGLVPGRTFRGQTTVWRISRPQSTRPGASRG